MIIGVLKEIHLGERRVALAPSGVKNCVKTGHSVLVEKGAGVIANFPDYQYEDSGAEIGELICDFLARHQTQEGKSDGG